MAKKRAAGAPAPGEETVEISRTRLKAFERLYAGFVHLHDQAGVDILHTGGDSINLKEIRDQANTALVECGCDCSTNIRGPIKNRK